MYSGQEITTGHWKFSDHFKWMSEDFELIHIYSVLHGWSRFSNVYANLKPYFLLWAFTTSTISEGTCIQRIKKKTNRIWINIIYGVRIEHSFSCHSYTIYSTMVIYKIFSDWQRCNIRGINTQTISQLHEGKQKYRWVIHYTLIRKRT